MRNGTLLFSAVQFLIVLAFLGGGGVFLGLHYLPNARQEFANWITNSSLNFLFLGSLILGIGILLGICFWAMQKSHYVRIRMGENQFSINETLIKQTITKFWKEEFPKESPPVEIYLAQQKIEVIAENSELDLKIIEKRLSDLLEQQFGYEKEFFLTLTNKA